MALLEHVSNDVLINSYHMELKTHTLRALRLAPLIQVTQPIKTS